MKHSFLFRADCAGESRRTRVLFGLYTVGMLLLTAMLLSALLLSLSAGPYPLEEVSAAFRDGRIFLMNTLPLALLLLLFYGLFRRAWLSYALTAVLGLLHAVGNYYVLRLRDDPLTLGLLKHAKEALTVVRQEGLGVELTAPVLLVLLGALALGLAVAFLVRCRPQKQLRGLLVLLAMALLLPAWGLCSSKTVYDALGPEEDAAVSEKQAHLYRGGLYPFLYSFRKESVLPLLYDEALVAETLGLYTAGQIPEEKRVNIIGIQLEAYNDFSRYGIRGVDFSAYDLYHALEAESYSGELLTNIFAGGTIDSERCILTGSATLGEYGDLSNSYVWYLRSQGYYAEGGHPYVEWFYDRSTVNANLGFENYYFMENYYNQFTSYTVAYDNIFMPSVADFFERHTAESDQPYFGFFVTYQGHGPYPNDYNEFNVDYVTGNFTQETEYILNNYLGWIADTNECLTQLVDRLRQSDEPVVLFLYGDHLPWLGNRMEGYTESGINVDLSTAEGAEHYYSTRYLIWANDAAKAVLGNDFKGEGPAISACYLMNEVFKLCGYEGPSYMQLMEEIREYLPRISSVGWLDEGKGLTNVLSEMGQQVYEAYRNLEYFYQHNFLYGDLAE